MIGAALLLALQAVAPTTVAPTTVAPTTVTPPGDEIVVTAAHRRCDVRLADQILSASDFNRHAAEWAAGRAVRVVVPVDAKLTCLTKIMVRLADHGVKRAVFVDPGDGP